MEVIVKKTGDGNAIKVSHEALGHYITGLDDEALGQLVVNDERETWGIFPAHVIDMDRETFLNRVEEDERRDRERIKASVKKQAERVAHMEELADD